LALYIHKITQKQKETVSSFVAWHLVFLSGRPVHLNTTSTSPGSIQSYCNYCTKTIHIQTSTIIYSHCSSYH